MMTEDITHISHIDNAGTCVQKKQKRFFSLCWKYFEKQKSKHQRTVTRSQAIVEAIK
jgi:hypothetical protein